MSRRNVFRATLLSVVVIFSLLSWIFFRHSLWTDGEWLWRLLLPSLSFLFFMIFSGIVFISESEEKILAIPAVSVAVSFLVVFFGSVVLSQNWEAGLLVFLAVAFMILSVIRLKREKDSRIKFSFEPVLRTGFQFFMTAAVLLASIAFYFSPSSRAGIDELVIPRNSFDKIINPLLKGIELPSFSKSGTSYGFSFIGDKAITQSANPRNEELDKQVSDSVYQLVNQLINNLGRPYKKFFSLGLAVSFFFALKIAQTLLTYLAIALTFGLFRILKRIGILSVKTIPAQKEIVEIL